MEKEISELLETHKREILYFDMDNTFCDYNSAFIESKKLNSEIKYPQSVSGFFLNLKPIPGSIDAYKLLKEKYDVLILSRASVFNPLSYMEKRLWIEKYLGFDACHNLILASDKTLLYGRYLIDDLEQFGRINPVWEHIHFGSKEYPDWNSIIKKLM